MRKRELIKSLKKHFNVNTKFFSDYDFEVESSSKTYFVKVLNVTSNHQVTINSKIVWDLKKGVISGIRFKTVTSSLVNLEEFNKLDNRIIVLTSKPFKVLKVLNESDLLDISNEKEVNDTFITSDIDELIEYIK
jgi:hypothetical protein